MVNPRGTNEKFALANLPDQKHWSYISKNAEIQVWLWKEKQILWLTETMEARRYVIMQNLRLLWSRNHLQKNFGILMQQGDQIFLNYVNMWMEEMELNGTFARLDAKYKITRSKSLLLAGFLHLFNFYRFVFPETLAYNKT